MIASLCDISFMYDHRYYNACSLTTNVPHQIETSQLVTIANQLTSFYIMGNVGG